MADPTRRDKKAQAPGPDYEWVDHDESYTYPPSKEDVEELRKKGFIGTWKQVKKDWQERRWGYWRRRAPIATWAPIPWLRLEQGEKELRIAPWADPSETLQAYYAILATIHDTDLQAVTGITLGVWPDGLCRAIHVWFQTFWGDKTSVIRRALRVVKDDLAVRLGTRDDAEEPPDLITLGVAVARFQVSKSTLKRAITDGRLHSYRPRTQLLVALTESENPKCPISGPDDRSRRRPLQSF
jgi:hypothetical protein